MKNELMFIGMDISKEVERLLTNERDTIINGMNETEIKAYDYGTKVSLSLLSAIINTVEENEIVVNLKGLKLQEEFLLADLKEYIKKNNK